MENVTTHSKAKLALALFTSPAAAFEEISRRRLLGTALFIVCITGAVAMLPWALAARAGEPLQLLMLGGSNPVAWLGLCFLFVWGMQILLKWLGTKVEFVELLTLMGWSQVALLLAQIGWSVVLAVQGDAAKHQVLINAAFAFYILGLVWYVALAGSAVHTLTTAPKARGVMTYLVVYAAATIACSTTYGNAKLTPFQNALPGVNATARQIVQVDQTPWVVAAIIGLIIGAALLAKAFGWAHSKARAAAAGAGLIGLCMLGSYMYGVHRQDYYGKLMNANDAYLDGNYTKAAEGFDSFLKLSKSNLSLTLDIANVYYLAKQDNLALARLKDAEDYVKGSDTDAKHVRAVIADHYGMVYDAQGNYSDALAEFEKASKDWAEFREPWVRMAVIYDRLGQYDKAIDTANHAVKKLDSEATVAWVALAQAFAQTGDTKQEKAAVAMVVGKDKKLAAKIDSSAGGWKDGVNQLSREDLKFQLEHDLAPQPKKPSKAKKK